jgi:gamma-glutamylcyclotransferase (GGCT)/AIG2-like uncharacterized protein YtfP
MNNFAYGSNMDPSFITEYCPSASFKMRAYLPNYEVQFRHYSEELGGGISSIIEAPGELVEGVLYDIPGAELDELDELESIDQGLYKRETFLVLGEDGAWHKADLYRVVEPKGPFDPAPDYIGKMITGATAHGLSQAYIERLVARQAPSG